GTVGMWVAEGGRVGGRGGTKGEVQVHRATVAGLRRVGAQGAGGIAAPPGHRRFVAVAQGGLRQDLQQDRLADAGGARRDVAVPARVLHGGARLPRARAALRQGPRRQIRQQGRVTTSRRRVAGSRGQSKTAVICSISTPSLATRRS